MKYFATTVIVILGAVTSLSLAQQGPNPNPNEDLNQDTDRLFEDEEAVEDFERMVSNSLLPMPHKLNDPGDKPEHGVCYKTYQFCLYPGQSLPYHGNKPCFFCKCSRNNRKICCREKPRPVVKNPLICKVTLDPTTCLYKRKPKCKKACKVIGWFPSRH